jgi:hypothetical protein
VFESVGLKSMNLKRPNVLFLYFRFYELDQTVFRAFISLVV